MRSRMRLREVSSGVEVERLYAEEAKARQKAAGKEHGRGMPKKLVASVPQPKARDQAGSALSAEGLSTRQIADVLGVDQSTVVRDLADANASPEPSVQFEAEPPADANASHGTADPLIPPPRTSFTPPGSRPPFRSPGPRPISHASAGPLRQQAQPPTCLIRATVLTGWVRIIHFTSKDDRVSKRQSTRIVSMGGTPQDVP